MNQGLIASVSTTITAPSADVWQALVTPAAIKQYMFGTTVTSGSFAGAETITFFAPASRCLATSALARKRC